MFFFQAEDGIRDAQESRGLGDVYKRQLQNTSEGVTLEIHRVAGTGNGKLNLHVFIFHDAQLNILNGTFHSVDA